MNQVSSIKSAVQNEATSQEWNESQNTLQSVFENQLVVEYDLKGNILSANEAFLRLTRYELSDLKGKPHTFLDHSDKNQTEFNDLITARLSEQVNEQLSGIWSKLTQGETCTGEFPFYNKIGGCSWLSCTYIPLKDSQNQIYKILQVSANINDTKSELVARTYAMDLTSLISETNLKGEIQYVNDKFIEVAKYTKEELIGQPHNIVRHPDMPKEVFKELWATIGRGKVFRGVVKNKSKDGKHYFVDAVMVPVMGENGKPKRYMGFRYDITEIQDQKLKSIALINALNSSYLFVEYNLEGKIISTNANFEKAMGYTAQEALGQSHHQFCHNPEKTKERNQQFWNELRAGKTQSGVFKRRNKAGELVWLHSVYAPVLDEVGRIMKFVEISADISGQRRILNAVEEVSSSLLGASAELTATATEMSDAASRTTKETQSVASVSTQVAGGVQMVAANIEEMVASIEEISRSTQETSQMVKSTLTMAQDSNVTIEKLGKSSQEIGDVVKVISSIAQQTNLLALNATIEAARAGEAGKGFAVVANEVKELAKQTAKATDDITKKISMIQNDTKHVINDIGGISQSIEKLSKISSVVASAVEEQSATTTEISRIVMESKTGVTQIASSIQEVSATSHLSSISSQQTLEASVELSKLAERLEALVSREDSSQS